MNGKETLPQALPSAAAVRLLPLSVLLTSSVSVQLSAWSQLCQHASLTCSYSLEWLVGNAQQL